MQEHFGRALRNRKRRSRLRVRVELSKDRRVLAEMLFQSIYATLVVGVVGSELRNLIHIGVLKVLEEPYQSP